MLQQSQIWYIHFMLSDNPLPRTTPKEDSAYATLLRHPAPTHADPSSSAPEGSSVTRMSSTINEIKKYMIKHHLKPGDPLPTEAALCAQLGVSRSSVREALRRLEALDIVRVHRGKGSFVGSMTMQPLISTLLLKNALDTSEGNQTISDIAQTRLALDLGIAPAVVEAMKGTHNPELHAIVDAMMEKTERTEAFPDEDIAFHQGILKHLHNDVMNQLVGSMWAVHQSLLTNLNLDSALALNMLTLTARTHGDMLKAAEAGDLEGYIEAVHQHYAPLQSLIAEVLA